jgi:hypothetical protein
MSGKAYEGVVKDGCVHISEGVQLPDDMKVFVVVPRESERVVRLSTPRFIREPGARPRRFSVQWK